MDFFVSYTAADEPWALWIAVELERAGYSTVTQVLDFRPGNDFVQAMQQATESADRTITVLSPAYGGSEFGESEWRPAFARDPSGEKGLLIPVRVQPGPPPGLLRTRIVIDLVGVDEQTARQRLLDGVSRRGTRPTSATFPGVGPSFPGESGEVGPRPEEYLDGLAPDRADALRAVNGPGLAALRTYLARGEAVAFLGAGASAPLHPPWTAVVGELIDAAVERGLSADAAATCRTLAGDRPDAVVEVLRRHLGAAQYQATLRAAFRVRRDPDTGRTWTPVHELVCRCPFQAVVTTNYDPGLVDARMRVRPTASETGFSSWTDEVTLDRWRTGDVFGGDELPVLYAHGHHNRPDEMVLATTEYRRAYAGKLAPILGGLVDTRHLVWIGFSFGDQRIAAVLREVAERTGTRIDPAHAARHVAILPWDPDGGQDPQTLRTLAEIEYGADLVLYPAPGGDHMALQPLLESLTDARYPAVGEVPRASEPAPALPVRWAHGEERVRTFTGRAEELARLDRWAADPAVRLVGVTAWGGAGKTALVTHWLGDGGAGRRAVFAWSFYSDPSAENWARAFLDWARDALDIRLAGCASMAAAVVAVARTARVVLVLDGLEVAQEGPASDGYGRLLDGVLREVLTALCRIEHPSLVVLTSRFPFADLQGFDGTTARMLDVPAFTPAEGAALLGSAAPGVLDEPRRRELVGQVDGHALAVSAIAALLSEHPESTATDLLDRLAGPGGTQAKVSRVLSFYADRLTDADRHLIAAVSLFARPVTVQQVLAIAGHETFAGHLDGWEAWSVRAAVHGPLAGLLTWHPNGTITAHPLVRQTFRPLALGAAEVAVGATLSDIPEGTVTSREQAQLVVEAIELLADAGQWAAANDLYTNRTASRAVWHTLPAARLGQRAAFAFVATLQRRERCRATLGPHRLGFYLNSMGLFATDSGDMDAAREHLENAVQHSAVEGDRANHSISLQNLSECLAAQGMIAQAARMAAKALLSADGDDAETEGSHVDLGWTYFLGGDTLAAEEQFLAADLSMFRNIYSHLLALSACYWAAFLVRTGRLGPAQRVVERSLERCRTEGWNDDVARSTVTLTRIGLAEPSASPRSVDIGAAIQCFRDGELLIELADSLTVAADHARHRGDLVTATDMSTEALTIAAPRSLIPTQAAALAVRARIAADQHTATGDPNHLHSGRDAADAARRLATGANPLPWHELDALRAHAHLDSAEGVDHGWAEKAALLHRQLVPDGLDPDPLATVEREIAAERARGQQR